MIEMSDTPTQLQIQSAIEELEAWKARHGVDFLIVAVSPWGKMTLIAFLLPDGFDAQVQVIKAEQAQ